MTPIESVNELVAKHDTALQAQDFAALTSCYTPDARIIDIKTIVKGGAGVADLWQECMPFFDKPIVMHRKEIQDTVVKNMVIRSYLSRTSGMMGEENMPEMWLRKTICFIKTDAVDGCGGFQICHEHGSFAVKITEHGMDVVSCC